MYGVEFCVDLAQIRDKFLENNAMHTHVAVIFQSSASHNSLSFPMELIIHTETNIFFIALSDAEKNMLMSIFDREQQWRQFMLTLQIKSMSSESVK